PVHGVKRTLVQREAATDIGAVVVLITGVEPPYPAAAGDVESGNDSVRVHHIDDAIGRHGLRHDLAAIAATGADIGTPDLGQTLAAGTMPRAVRRVPPRLRPGGVAHLGRQRDLRHAFVHCERLAPRQHRLPLTGDRRLLGAEPVIEHAAATQGQRREHGGTPPNPRVPYCHADYPPRRLSRPLARSRTPLGAPRSSARRFNVVLAWSMLPRRMSSSASCSSARARQGLLATASPFSRDSSRAGSPPSIWCCAQSRLARPRSSGSAEVSPATLSQSAMAPGRS